jgi:glycosyltransferase involved in cell wall biosynthesis
MKIVIIGSAHPLRGGGISTFNQRLAREFNSKGDDCTLYSFSLQYPSFLFPGKSQYTDEPAPKDLKILSIINSINPFNWLRVGNKLRKEKADIIVVRFWLPFMAPAFGTILRRAKKNKATKVICIADNIIPHEHRPGDKTLTKYFLSSCDAFITMSDKVMDDLRKIEKEKPARLVPHPLYDNFGEALSKDEAKKKLGIDNSQPLILFFGFIRNYKGLDILLDAMKILTEKTKGTGLQDLKLLIAGEFYEDEKKYRDQINRLGIADNLILRADFIPDDQVKYYLSAADAVVQPYRSATQSGVTPLAYHFEKPMIVTNVGGLASLVPHEQSGLVAEPDANSIADAILRFYQLGENYFIPHLRNEKKKYSWSAMVETIKELAF